MLIIILHIDQLDQESNEFRTEIMSCLAPFAFAGFRVCAFPIYMPRLTWRTKYPCFTFPEDLFLVSESVSKAGALNYTNYPADRPTKITLEYFGQPTILRLPPIALFAILSYFARIDYLRLKTPPELPLNRQDAITRGILCGPTRDDIDVFNVRCATRVASGSYGDPFDGLPKSRRHDPDWRRSLSSSDSALSYYPLVYYTPGTFSGRWQGSFVVSFPFRLFTSQLKFPGTLPGGLPINVILC